MRATRSCGACGAWQRQRCRSRRKLSPQGDSLPAAAQRQGHSVAAVLGSPSAPQRGQKHCEQQRGRDEHRGVLQGLLLTRLYAVQTRHATGVRQATPDRLVPCGEWRLVAGRPRSGRVCVACTSLLQRRRRFANGLGGLNSLHSYPLSCPHTHSAPHALGAPKHHSHAIYAP